MTKMGLYPQLVGTNIYGPDLSSEESDQRPHNIYILCVLLAGDQLTSCLQSDVCCSVPSCQNLINKMYHLTIVRIKRL
jgi:hypothetical protein